MANVVLSTETYREASYLDCSIIFNDIATISGIGLAASGTITISDPDYDFTDGDSVYVNDVEGTTELNNRIFTIVSGTAVSGTDQTTYYIQQDDLYINTSAYTAWTGEGTVERYATTISGLEHLEGLTVKVLSEGYVLPDVVVTSGTITLPYSIKYGIIGLGYDAYITSMPLEFGNDIGASIGARKKISDVFVRLYKSLGMRMGYDDEHTDVVPFRTSEYNMDEAIPLFTGDKRFVFNKGFDAYQTLCVKSDQPLPMTVLAIVPAQYTSPR